MPISEYQKKLLKLHREAYEIKVEVLSGGTLPFKAHASDAGFDLFATQDIVIEPGCGIKHPLNIKIQLPLGTYAQIESKSGLGAKGLLVYAGVIDQNYRGIPHVVGAHIRINDGESINIKKGEKLAQMTMRPHNNEYYITQVEAVDSSTDRGNSGFGSTGK